MNIVPIFADQLFAFHYDGEVDNEYDRLMELWTDVAALKAYLNANGVLNEDSFFELLIELQ